MKIVLLSIATLLALVFASWLDSHDKRDPVLKKWNPVFYTILVFLVILFIWADPIGALR